MNVILLAYSILAFLAINESLGQNSVDVRDHESDTEDEDLARGGLSVDEEDAILKSRQRKKKLFLAAQRFNRDGDKAFGFIQVTFDGANSKTGGRHKWVEEMDVVKLY
jgi:hypothetical protein